MNREGLIATIAAAIVLFVFSKSLKKKKKNSGIPPIIPTPILHQHTSSSTSPSASASASTSTSAAAAANVLLVGEYEVFLSFCGEDTRHGFTDFLYTYLDGAGIRTFRDNEGLHVGEEIGLELLKAINGSKISIPVFSKSYASSKWCLRELAQMVECHENGGHMIFPIFYDVNPYDVRHQSGSYEEAFRQHKKNCFDEMTVQGWKEALEKVGQLKGLELEKETGGREGELVKMIVENVLEVLKNYKHETKYLVGMDDHIEKMDELLKDESNGVRIIGIHGMGGLGKTTIAKVIYNKICEHFERHCFIEDVGENSKGHNGIVRLQNQLLCEILKTKIFNANSEDEGIKKIKDAVHEKKVFIVLDDVDVKSQIDKLVGSYRWFGPGSRIIITTRNEEAIRALEQTCIREGQLEVYKSYKPELMDDNHSLQLFSKYAFMSDYPPKGYYILSKEVVSTAAGLPLVLVTIGSSLFGEKDTDFWQEKLRKLKEIPEKEVLEKLRLSFDPLDNRQKQIFLDIACFFIGEDKRNPCYMWDDCKFYPRDGLNVLVRRSLITVGDDNILRMHDQLRDLGRQIVCEGIWNEPGRWSRVWRNDDAWAIIKTRQGTKNVEALNIDLGAVEEDEGEEDEQLVFVHRRQDFSRLMGQDFSRLMGQDFSHLPNIRFLRLGYVDLDGDFKHLFSNLRWLKWGCSGNFAPTNFHLENLVILDLSNSNMKDDWEGWSQIKVAKKLRVLNLSGSNGLRRGPNFSSFKNLEILILSHCLNLKEINPSLGNLITLRALDLSHCWGIRTLDCSTFKDLESLDVSSTGLRELNGLEWSESLANLNASNSLFLRRLPDLPNLKKLKKSKKLKKLEILNSFMLPEIQDLLPEIQDIQDLLPEIQDLESFEFFNTVGGNQ